MKELGGAPSCFTVLWVTLGFLALLLARRWAPNPKGSKGLVLRSSGLYGWLGPAPAPVCTKGPQKARGHPIGSLDGARKALSAMAGAFESSFQGVLGRLWGTIGAPKGYFMLAATGPEARQ